MAILSFRVSNYAQNIYVLGKERLTARDGFKGVQRSPDDYYVPVQQFAADKYYIEQLQNAQAQGWLTQQEYDETLAKKTASSPQHDPTLTVAPTA